MKQQLKLRIVVLDPPKNAPCMLQRGRSELHAPTKVTAKSIVFDFTVTLADLSTSPPRLTGEFTQGRAGKRFVYVNSGSYAGHASSPWSRRAKIHLDTITRDLIEQALATDGVLEASYQGTGRDGGPACATVPLVKPWNLAR